MNTVTLIPELSSRSFRALNARDVVQYALKLLVVGSSYFVLAKHGWTLAQTVHSGAPPIWPASGLALAAVLLQGMEVLPALFVAALVASAQSSPSRPHITCSPEIGKLVCGIFSRILKSRHLPKQARRLLVTEFPADPRAPEMQGPKGKKG
jgi:hypothetical protein